MRGQATTLVNEVDQKRVKQVDRSAFVTLLNRVTTISGALKEVDSQIEQGLTAGHAHAEFESVLEYKIKIVESLS